MQVGRGLRLAGVAVAFWLSACESDSEDPAEVGGDAGIGGSGGEGEGAGGDGIGAGGERAGAGGDPAGGGGSGGTGGEAAESVLETLNVSPQVDTLLVGEPEQLTVTGVYSDGSDRDLTADAEWETSDADVATVEAGGMVTVHRGGPVTLTARIGDVTATLETSATCEYPRFGNAVRYGSIIPPLFWEGAYRPDGSQFDFKLADVHCNAEYKDVKVVIFLVSAGWCAPCTLYAQRLRPEAADIEAAGSLLVFLESETTDFGPADNEFAQRHVDHIIGDSYGIRVGDHDAQPRADWLHTQPIVTGYPTTIAVRTRDMRVITDSNHSQYYLPLLQIVQDPEADWSNPGLPPFNDHCEEGDEEASEPNDVARDAAPLPPGTVEGGICTEQPDFYQIDVDGPWRLSLDFDGEVADLDVFAWDSAIEQPLQVGADIVGSNGVTSHEEFEYQGPTTIAVIGYQGASAPYRLQLETR